MDYLASRKLSDMCAAGFRCAHLLRSEIHQRRKLNEFPLPIMRLVSGNKNSPASRGDVFIITTTIIIVAARSSLIKLFSIAEQEPKREIVVRNRKKNRNFFALRLLSTQPLDCRLPAPRNLNGSANSN